MMLTVATFITSTTEGLDELSTALKVMDDPAIWLLRMSTGTDTVVIWLLSGGMLMVLEKPV